MNVLKRTQECGINISFLFPLGNLITGFWDGGGGGVLGNNYPQIYDSSRGKDRAVLQLSKSTFAL